MFLICFYGLCSIFTRTYYFYSYISHSFYKISHYESTKSIDDNLYKKIIDAKSKQNCKLSIRYTAADKWYGVTATSYYRIKDGFKIVTSQTEKRIVSNNCCRSSNMTSIWLWNDVVTSYGRRVNVVSAPYVYWKFS